MSKVTDGATFILQHPVVIQETYTYKAVSGARKTILVLDVNKEKVGKEIAKLRAAAEAKQAAELAAENAKQEINQRIEHAKWRTWSCADGKFTIGAKFMGVISGVVTLEKTDGQRIQVGLDRLSKDDQAFIRDRKWLSPAATVAAPATPQIAADRPRSPSVAVPLDLKDCVLLLTFDRDTLTATGAGLAIRDLSPRGNNCVVSGASLVDGKVGTALAFDGKGDHVLLTGLREDLVEDTTGLTVAMWFLPRGMRRTNFLFDMGEPTRQTPNSVVRMLFEPDQRGGISLLFAVVGTGTRVVPSLSGRWHHLVGTWDSAQLRVFLDGELLGEQVKKSGALTSASVGPSAARLGSEATGTGGPDGKSRNFAGAIDEFLVLRRALSSAEVTELYQMGVDGRTLSLGP
jgi:uncharacterized cupin superfamily protein